MDDGGRTEHSTLEAWEPGRVLKENPLVRNCCGKELQASNQSFLAPAVSEGGGERERDRLQSTSWALLHFFIFIFFYSGASSVAMLQKITLSRINDLIRDFVRAGLKTACGYNY